MDKDNTKNLVVCECKRIIEILESEAKLISWHSPIVSELKAKMHELRRDTKRLENQIYRPEEFGKSRI